MLRYSVIVAAMILTTIVLGGCPNRPKGYNMTVQLDESLRRGTGRWPTIEVDMFAVDDAQLEQWKARGIDQYFSANSPDRDQAVRGHQAKTFKFRDDQAAPQTLKANEWPAAWKGKSNLIVLANLPSLSNATDPNGNKRRLVLPLGAKHWKTEDIQIEVWQQSVALSKLTPRAE